MRRGGRGGGGGGGGGDYVVRGEGGPVAHCTFNRSGFWTLNQSMHA